MSRVPGSAEPSSTASHPRPDVHASSRARLGAANPRQEGPTDLRLVPPALAAWLTAATMVDAASGWVVGVAVGCLVAGAGLLVVRRRGGRRVAVAAVLLCVAAAAASAGLHGADLRRGPVPALVREYATVTAELEVTSDPRLTRPRVKGDHMAPASVLIGAEVRRVEEAGGAAVATRTPVLVIVDVGAGSEGEGEGRAPDGSGGRTAGGAGATGTGVAAGVGAGGQPGAGAGSDGRLGVDAGFERPSGAGAGAGADVGLGGGGQTGVRVGASASAWLRLLPSTRVRVSARLAPTVRDGDRVVGVARVSGREAPEVVAEVSGVQRFAGRLRAGLRAATDPLPGDARALLPGLVVGDTSRITPELDEAFKATDLAHTLAVSGSNLTIILALLIGPPGLAQRVERRGLAPRLGIPLRTTAVLGGVLTLAFVVVCRPDPSVLRAAACGAVVLLALATGRRRSLIPALATAVLLLVLYDPWLGRSYGFLLSVLATGALLTIGPRWSAALQRRRVPARLAEALAAAGAAQALCAPVVAVLSARVSLVAVPCNLLAEFA
ncbi:MAG: ComEC/Rec2 family competence protein, partial [Streptomyces sp.]|nr:ComEC/Rec2 family competence protein [Streptomyces sp.]